MFVGISVFELHIPAARSLKEKRRVVRALIDRLHQRHRVSILESDHHDLHQRAEIGIALLAATEQQLQSRLDGMRTLIEAHPDCELTFWDPQILSAME